MKIGIALFAYNRSWHFQQVVKGLQKNDSVDRVYIFQDGLKCDEHRHEWEKVQEIIKSISWCETIYYCSNVNKGLAKSIINGINIVLKDNDAVIVLEDDCVPTENFVTFMKACFEKYQSNKNVYSVTGYSWPIKISKDQYDIYGCGRISSWGWGTWKDRWEQYKIDYEAFKRIKEDKDKSKNLAIWGNDLEQTVIGNIKGETDSWAVYWALYVIEKGGICINPYVSLIQNVGFDGTGVHCGFTDQFQVNISDGLQTEFALPDDIKILHKAEVACVDLFGSYTAINEESEMKENVLVYGLGNFYFSYEKDINEKYNVKAFIDRRKKGWFAGKKIIRPEDIQKYEYDKVIIMVRDMQEIIVIIKRLIDIKINSEKIVIGYNLCKNYIQQGIEVKVLSDGKLLVDFGNHSIRVKTKNEFDNIYKVFLKQKYNYYINNKQKDIIFDIGMNVGETSLYFVQRENTEKVFGYEPFDEFNTAKENLKDYLSDTNRLEIFHYGLSNENTRRSVSRKDTGKVEYIEVRKVYEELEPIVRLYPHNNIVLKIDCDREETEILDEIFQSKIVNNITLIILKGYHKRKENILNFLKNVEFSWWYENISESEDIIYAYRYKTINAEKECK